MLYRFTKKGFGSIDPDLDVACYTFTHSHSSPSFSHRTQHSHLMWKAWPRRSALFWWPRLRWRSMRETPRCWWTCSTVWPNLTPALLNYARHGWIAWPVSMWRMETSLRYITHSHTHLHVCLKYCEAHVLWFFLSLQAAMCYVHVAALVAEYLRRKG